MQRYQLRVKKQKNDFEFHFIILSLFSLDTVRVEH